MEVSNFLCQIRRKIRNLTHFDQLKLPVYLFVILFDLYWMEQLFCVTVVHASDCDWISVDSNSLLGTHIALSHIGKWCRNNAAPPPTTHPLPALVVAGARYFQPANLPPVPPHQRKTPYLVSADRVRAVVHVQVIVAVHLHHVEAQHEALQNGVRLERDDAVQVALVLRPEYGTLNLAVDLLQEMVLANRLHVIWRRREKNTSVCLAFKTEPTMRTFAHLSHHYTCFC